MRILLYNIRYGAGTGRHVHFPLPFIGYLKRTNGNLKQIAEFIKSMEPDITGLIEVDFGSFRADRLNQAAAIAGEMNHDHVYRSKYSLNSVAQFLPVMNKQGNALLTNQKIISKRFHYFSKGVKRLVIELELADLTVFLVHLSLKFRYRQDQLRELHDMVGSTNKPVIVAGDFNPFWGDQELNLFLAASGLRNINRTGQPSHPSRSPSRQLDYILHSPEIRPVDFQLPHVQFSDHVPLVCDFELK